MEGNNKQSCLSFDILPNQYWCMYFKPIIILLKEIEISTRKIRFALYLEYIMELDMGYIFS